MEFMAPFVSSEMMRVSISPSSPPSNRKPISKVRHTLQYSNDRCPKKHAGWSSKDWNSKSNWQRSAVEDAGQSSQDKWKRSKPRAKWKEISHNVEELGVLLKEKKTHGSKVARKVRNCETEIFAISEGMAEDAKVDDGDRSRLMRALKELRKDREEERAARELLEEMQQNLDEAQERASVSERSLCRELEEYMYSWDPELGRPHNLSTKIWQMMQSNNTKSDNLESDFAVADILEKTHPKSIRVWAEKEVDESP